MPKTTMSKATFTVPTPTVLTNALRIITPMVDMRSDMETLRGVLVQISKGGCLFTGTNLEQTVQIRVPEIEVQQGADISNPVSFIITKKTIDAIAKLPDTPITFEVDTAYHILTIKYSDQSEQRHNILDAADYPPVPEVTGIGGATPDPIPMGNIDWRRVSFAVATGKGADARPIFQGVHMDLQRGKIVATDTRVLAVMGLDVGMGTEIGDNRENTADSNLPAIKVNIPVKAIDFIAKMDNPAIIFTSDNGQIKAVSDGGTGDTTLFSRLIPGQYPDYEIIAGGFSGGFVTTAEFPRDEMLDAVERASLMISNDKDNNAVQFKFSVGAGGGDSYCEVCAQGATGTVAEYVPCKVTGEKLDVWFNYKFFADVVKHADVGDGGNGGNAENKVIAGFTGPTSPALFYGAGDCVGGGGGGATGTGINGKWFCVLSPVVPKGV